jgi:hypothetical protein
VSGDLSVCVKDVEMKVSDDWRRNDQIDLYRFHDHRCHFAYSDSHAEVEPSNRFPFVPQSAK